MSPDLRTRVVHSVLPWVVVVSVPMSLWSVAQGAIVTTETNVALNQSASDALQGRIGVLSAGATVGFGQLSELTDAVTPTTPDGILYFNPNFTVTITYDLGEAGSATRELTSVSIWLHAGDGHRVDYAGGLAVSSDNVSFTEVASTGRVEFTSGVPSQSHVLYSFTPTEVMGFRYLRIRDEAVFQDQGTIFGTGPYHPWFIEIDAFLTPLGPTGDYNQNGTVDAADYVVWRKNEGTTNMLPNDPIGSTIGQGQYDQWRANFGATAGNGALANTTVPEPATASLLTLALVAVSRRRGARPLRVPSIPYRVPYVVNPPY